MRCTLRDICLQTCLMSSVTSSIFIVPFTVLYYMSEHRQGCPPSPCCGVKVSSYGSHGLYYRFQNGLNVPQLNGPIFTRDSLEESETSAPV